MARDVSVQLHLVSAQGDCLGIFEMCSYSNMLLKIALANGKVISCG